MSAALRHFRRNSRPIAPAAFSRSPAPPLHLAPPAQRAWRRHNGHTPDGDPFKLPAQGASADQHRHRRPGSQVNRCAPVANAEKSETGVPACCQDGRQVHPTQANRRACGACCAGTGGPGRPDCPGGASGASDTGGTAGQTDSGPQGPAQRWRDPGCCVGQCHRGGESAQDAQGTHNSRQAGKTSAVHRHRPACAGSGGGCDGTRSGASDGASDGASADRPGRRSAAGPQVGRSQTNARPDNRTARVQRPGLTRPSVDRCPRQGDDRRHCPGCFGRAGGGRAASGTAGGCASRCP